MRILYNSKNKEFKTPFGCVNPDEKCTINIHVPVQCNIINVSLCLYDDYGFDMQVPMVKNDVYEQYEIFTAEFSLSKKGLYFYYFKFKGDTEFSLYKYGDDTNIEEGDVWQITCCNTHDPFIEDFSGKVMYQIFPDRFCKKGNPDLSDKLTPFTVHKNVKDIPVYKPDENGEVLNNDFYGGNIKGIISKLQYLKKLGVGIIYLNPIFKAFSNHRYDTADYKTIDPMLGTEKDFVSLCKRAHKLGIKIILDGVFSHTGSDSIYFDAKGHFGTGVCSNENSPYKDWFEFQEFPHTYTSWWGIKTLPCVKELSPSYMDYIIYNEDSVIKHWLKLGADGFRLDVADELPDEFLMALKKEMKKFKKDSFLIGEVWEDASNKISYGVRRKYFSENVLDSVMNYPFRNLIIDFVKGNITPVQFADEVLTIAENYPPYVLNLLMNMLSTHDTPRILSVLGTDNLNFSKEEQSKFYLSDEDYKRGVCLEKIAALIQFTLPGNPCIYYGDEIGMQGLGDPFCRGFYNNDEKDESLQKFYVSLAKLKNKSNALKKGDISFDKSDADVLSYTRSYNGEKIKVLVSKREILEKNIVFEIKTPYFNGVVVKEK